MFLIFLFGLALGWATGYFDKIPTAKAVDAWVRDKLSVWS